MGRTGSGAEIFESLAVSTYVFCFCIRVMGLFFFKGMIKVRVRVVMAFKWSTGIMLKKLFVLGYPFLWCLPI